LLFPVVFLPPFIVNFFTLENHVFKTDIFGVFLIKDASQGFAFESSSCLLKNKMFAGTSYF